MSRSLSELFVVGAVYTTAYRMYPRHAQIERDEVVVVYNSITVPQRENMMLLFPPEKTDSEMTRMVFLYGEKVVVFFLRYPEQAFARLVGRNAGCE